MPTYHKKKLANALASLWAGEGYINSIGDPHLLAPDGATRVNVVSLALVDPMAAARLIAWSLEAQSPDLTRSGVSEVEEVEVVPMGDPGITTPRK